MDTLRIEVCLPARGSTYEVRVPCALNTLAAAQLSARALEALSEGAYAASGNSAFAWAESGQQLNMQQSMEQAGVKNGSKLLLI